MGNKLQQFNELPTPEIIYENFRTIFKSEVIQSRFEDLIKLESNLKETAIDYAKDKSDGNWKAYASARGRFNSEKAAIKRMLLQRYKIAFINEVISINKIEPDYSLVQFLAKTIDGKILDKNSVKTMIDNRNFYKDNKIPYETQEENENFFEAFKLTFHTGIIYGPTPETAWIPHPKSIPKRIANKI